jgi:hypothetical protein
MFERAPESTRLPQPHRHSIRPVSRVERIAVASCDEGTLRVEVLGYEAPDASPEADRLLVSLEWECTADSGRREGPLFYADDIAAWADRIATVSVEGTEFSLTERDFRVTCLARDWNGDLVLGIDVGGELPFVTTIEISYAAWKAFGRALQRLARAFPQRDARDAMPEAA